MPSATVLLYVPTSVASFVLIGLRQQDGQSGIMVVKVPERMLFLKQLASVTVASFGVVLA